VGGLVLFFTGGIELSTILVFSLLPPRVGTSVDSRGYGKERE
jgi:hypothetical protein